MNILWLEAEQGIMAGTTLRTSAELEDANTALHTCRDQNIIIENRRKLAEQIGCELTSFVCAEQIHGCGVQEVREADRGRGAFSPFDAIPATDALYTFEKGIVLCCFTADCVPVFLWNKPLGLIGLIHSGWKGTVEGITESVLTHLLQDDRCRPQDVHIHLGISLCEKHFEIGEDVASQFSALGYASDLLHKKEASGKFQIENKAVIRRQCERCGILPQNITTESRCTYEDPEGFSYRKDRAFGRHLSFIVMR